MMLLLLLVMMIVIMKRLVRMRMRKRKRLGGEALPLPPPDSVGQHRDHGAAQWVVVGRGGPPRLPAVRKGPGVQGMVGWRHRQQRRWDWRGPQVRRR